MPFTQHELELRKLAEDRIAKKLLPGSIPEHLWAGQGSGQPCSLCGEPISLQEIEYEIDNQAAGDGRTYRFHLSCHAMWQLALSTRRTAP
jgi:hypothetical protein